MKMAIHGHFYESLTGKVGQIGLTSFWGAIRIHQCRLVSTSLCVQRLRFVPPRLTSAYTHPDMHKHRQHVDQLINMTIQKLGYCRDSA